jgi:hypothetical protein
LRSQFFAYATTFRGGVNVTSGDVDGDGIKEVITGAGPLGSPHIRIFSPVGALHSQFFAFPSTWRTGGSVTALDLTGDGKDELVVAPSSGAAHLRVFTFNPQTRRYDLMTQRFAYPITFRGGVNLASGDLDQDGRDELVVAPASRGGPQVRVFSYRSQTNTLEVISQFFAYPSNFTTGVSVAVGDLNGDGGKEIITGAGPDREPVVRAFNAGGVRIFGMLAMSQGFRGGVVVATVQADGDGAEELVTGPWKNGSSVVTITNINSTFTQAALLRRFGAFPLSVQGGVRLNGY